MSFLYWLWSFWNWFSNLVRFKGTNGCISCSTDNPWCVVIIEIHKIRALDAPKQIYTKGKVLGGHIIYFFKGNPLLALIRKSYPHLVPFPVNRLIADLKNLALQMAGFTLLVAESPSVWEQQSGGSTSCVTWPGEISWSNTKWCLFGSSVCFLPHSSIFKSHCNINNDYDNSDHSHGT